MIDDKPPVPPKEPAFWKGTIFSIAVHALLVGTIWMAATHKRTVTELSKVENQSTALRETTAKMEPTTSSAVPPEIKSVSNESKADVSVGEVARAPNKIETMQTGVAAKPTTKIILVETKHARQRHLTALTENRKLTEDKKIVPKSDRVLARQREQLKLAALAQKKKQKIKAERIELLAKKHAVKTAIKMAADTQRRRELDDERVIGKLHQEEMRRITSGSEGNG